MRLGAVIFIIFLIASLSAVDSRDSYIYNVIWNMVLLDPNPRSIGDTLIFIIDYSEETTSYMEQTETETIVDSININYVGTHEHIYVIDESWVYSNSYNLMKCTIFEENSDNWAVIDFIFLPNTDIIEESIIISPLILNQNYPNPFNPETKINFSVMDNTEATFTIYNIRGEVVKSFREYSTGDHTIIWGGKDNKEKKVSSGIYLYELKSKNQREIRKMILTK